VRGEALILKDFRSSNTTGYFRTDGKDALARFALPPVPPVRDHTPATLYFCHAHDKNSSHLSFLEEAPLVGATGRKMPPAGSKRLPIHLYIFPLDDWV